MKVFCRFAPPPPYERHRHDACLVLRAEGELRPQGGLPAASLVSSHETVGTRVHLADPVTLSKAAFSCDGIFLHCHGSHTAAGGLLLDSSAAEKTQQEALYAATCRDVLCSASPSFSFSAPPSSRSALSSSLPTQRPLASGQVPRNIYLAYGQTASGKTYSLFGDSPLRTHERRSASRRLMHEAAGVVPRYLYDVFFLSSSASSVGEMSREGEVFVDLSCFEVYNETTTDLVALSASLSPMSVNNSTTTSATAAQQQQQRLRVEHEQSPVWAARNAYRDGWREAEEEDEEDYREDRGRRSGNDSLRLAHLSMSSQCDDDDASTLRSDRNANMYGTRPRGPASRPSIRTDYKATEKQQVLRSVDRARCFTFAEAQSVLFALLTLRQECATGRNDKSSRGHLVVRIEEYRAAAAAAEEKRAGSSSCVGGSEGRWVLAKETAFVDLAGSESGRPVVGAGDLRAGNGLGAAGRRPRGRSSNAPSSRASSRHSGTSLDTSAQSIGGSSRRSRSSGGSSSSRLLHDDTTIMITAASGAAASSSSSAFSTRAYHRYLLHPPQEEDAKAAQVRRQRETRCINASLLALRKVFRALYEATNSATHAGVAERKLLGGSGGGGGGGATAGMRRPPLHHAPFKDSALTTILQPFLLPPPPPQANAVSANVDADSPSSSSFSQPSCDAAARVVLLVCCSSRSVDFYETVASLRLGAEATAVNPEVMLRALPVQQREQQQEHERRQQLRPLHVNALLPGKTTEGVSGDSGGGGRTSGVQRLRRSASAPHQRLLSLHDSTGAGQADAYDNTHAVMKPRTSVDCPSSLCQANDKNVKNTGAEREKMASGSQLGTAPSSDTVSGLAAEVQRYKSAAQQLYTQCKSLCTSYDDCVAELGRCRALLQEKDARIAALEQQLAAVHVKTATTANDSTTTGFVRKMASTLDKNEDDAADADGGDTRGGVFRRTERTMAATPTRNETEKAQITAADASSPQPISPYKRSPLPNKQQPPQQRRYGLQQQPIELSNSHYAARRLEEHGSAPRPSRALSGSAAREDSARCLVSLSPFSTASAMAAATAGREERLREMSDGGADARSTSVSEERADGAAGVDAAVVDAPSSAGGAFAASMKHEEGGGSGASACEHTQHRHARFIMNTLLARQIFPPPPPLQQQQLEATEEAASTVAAVSVPLSGEGCAPVRETSPSPVLPALTAHTIATTTGFHATASASAETHLQPAAHSCLLREETHTSTSALSIASPSAGETATASAPTAEDARRSNSGNSGGAVITSSSASSQLPSSPPLLHVAHMDKWVTRPTDQCCSADGSSSTTVRRRSEDTGHTGEVPVQHNGLAAAAPDTPQTVSMSPLARAAAQSITAMTPCIGEEPAPSPKHHEEPTAEAAIQRAYKDGKRATGDDDEEDVNEIVISLHNSPAARLNVASLGSTARSRSSAHTVLMPPSPSRSPLRSRTPPSSIYQL